MAENITQNRKIKGYIHSIESFGLVDGPGVRSVVFMQGCPMRCLYCHNPDTWQTSVGEEWEAKPLLDKLLHFRDYWRNNGGITVSGGEPLLQPEFVTELFRLAKEQGVQTALDTSGCLFTKEQPYFGKIRQLLQYTDLVLLDLKLMDTQQHKKLTGHGNERIVEFARFLSEINKAVWIRRVLVPGLTDDGQELRELKAFTDSLKNVQKIELLPYHTLALPKYEKLGIDYPLKDTPTPTEQQIERAKEILNI